METKLHHYSRTVTNIDEVSNFFIKYFGFRCVNRRNDLREKYLERILNTDDLCMTMQFLEGCGLMIELFEFSSPKGCTLDMQTINIGSTHLCFQVDNIFELYNRMKNEGVRFVSEEPILIDKGGHAGGYSLYLLDPDNTIIELLQLPESR